MMDNLEIGDVVMVTGKPREFNNDIYLSAETAKKIDIMWANVRKLELQKRMNELIDIKTKEGNKTPDSVKEDLNLAESQEVNDYTEDVKSIVGYIKKNDLGEGVEVSQVIKNCGEGVKAHIDKMIKRGDIFEIRSGVLKLV